MGPRSPAKTGRGDQSDRPACEVAERQEDAQPRPDSDCFLGGSNFTDRARLPVNGATVGLREPWANS